MDGAAVMGGLQLLGTRRGCETESRLGGMADGIPGDGRTFHVAKNRRKSRT